MVFDLGGGTFDVSIIEIGNGVIEVLSTSGDNHLGGDDFNEALAQYILTEFEKSSGISLKNDLMAMQRVKEAAEKAKIELSSMISTVVSLPFIITTTLGPQNLEMTITRETFNRITKDLVERTILPMQNALNDARLLPAELNKIILVGGSSRIPAVQDKIKEVTGITPSKSLNPDECVAMGAGIQGGKLSGDITAMGNYDVLLLDVTPLTLSIETVGGVATPLIDRNTPIPTSHSQIFTTSANFQTQVEINVLQGERPLAKDNKSLGKFKLKKIKRAMRGVPQIEVTFDIDVNGIVSVSAKDLASGNMQSITIENGSHMSDEDIERAIHEAKQFEQQDAMTKERLVFKNDLETLISRVENALAKHHKEIDKTVRTQIKNELNQLVNETLQQIHDILKQAEGALDIFLSNYNEMKALRESLGYYIDGADEYYHTKANYQAAQLGEISAATALLLGYIREILDFFKEILFKGQSVKDAFEHGLKDLESNRRGRKLGKENPNKEPKDIIKRPKGIPEIFW